MCAVQHFSSSPVAPTPPSTLCLRVLQNSNSLMTASAEDPKQIFYLFSDCDLLLTVRSWVVESIQQSVQITPELPITLDVCYCYTSML